MNIIKNIAIALAVAVIALAPCGCIRPIAVNENGEIGGGIAVSPLASLHRVQEGEAAAQAFGETLAENQERLAEGQRTLAEGQARLADAAGDMVTKAAAEQAVNDAVATAVSTVEARMEKRIADEKRNIQDDADSAWLNAILAGLGIGVVTTGAGVGAYAVNKKRQATKAAEAQKTESA